MEPADFAGAEIVQGSGVSITGGAARAVTAAGVDPATIAARAFVHVAGTLAPVGPDATGAASALAGAQVAAGGGAVTVANPSSVAPVTVTVTVTATP